MAIPFTFTSRCSSKSRDAGVPMPIPTIRLRSAFHFGSEPPASELKEHLVKKSVVVGLAGKVGSRQVLVVVGRDMQQACGIDRRTAVGEFHGLPATLEFFRLIWVGTNLSARIEMFFHDLKNQIKAIAFDPGVDRDDARFVATSDDPEPRGQLRQSRFTEWGPRWSAKASLTPMTGWM